MTFNVNDKVTNIRGKDYLEVKWRIVWFREEHPKGAIITEIANRDPVIIRAVIHDNDGVIIGTGMGSPKTQGVSAGRPFEGAETAAIGRALAHAGYGTQFTGEDEGEHLADSPVEQPKKKSNGAQSERPLEPQALKTMLAKKVLQYQGKKASVEFRSFIAGALGSCLKDDRERYAVTEYLTGQTSIKDISDEMVFAFRDWLGMGDGTEPSEEADKEINKVLRAALKEQGQTEMEM